MLTGSDLLEHRAFTRVGEIGGYPSGHSPISLAKPLG
jgi:hypothetical protein